MSTTTPAGFRNDIQGIRAIAVALVVVYHAGVVMPGGFIGVDVFFVVSGFVITRMLLKEFDAQGKINFRNFYLRLPESLDGRFAIPDECGPEVLSDVRSADFVNTSKIELRVRIMLLCRTSEPLLRFNIILWKSNPIPEADSQPILRRSRTAHRSLPIILHGLLWIACNTLAVLVADS
jgi:hypothetical protein